MVCNLLLDWSGTLVDDLPPVIGATNFVLEQFGRPSLDRENFRRHFRLPFTDFYDEFLPGVPLDALEALFHRKFVELQGSVTPLPGLMEFLDFCQASERRVFLLSSMRSEHFEVQAKQLGIRQHFEHPYVGVRDKRIQIKKILQRHHLAPDETAFVGDMVHDIEAAQHGGVMSIAILTGYDTLEKLASAHPDVVVSSLHHLRRLLAAKISSSQQPSNLSNLSTDSIVISGIEVRVPIGVAEDERASPQRLEIDLVLESNLREANDDIARTTDYAQVTEWVTKYCEATKFRLLESLAEGVAEELLARFPLIAALTIEIRKFILPYVKHTGVRFRRIRNF